MNKRNVSIGAVLGAVAAAVMVFVAPPKAPKALVWDYPQAMPVSNVVFVVYHSTNLVLPGPGNASPWQVFAVVSAPPVGFWPTQRQEFFYVRASNTVSHLVSP